MIDQSYRRQGQAHKTKGSGNQAAYEGGFTEELYAFTNAATGADRTIVAGVTDKKIRVLSYSLSGPAGSVSTSTIKSETAGAISPLISLAANGFAAESDNNGLFETTAGEGLTIATSATVGVRVTYILVD